MWSDSSHITVHISVFRPTLSQFSKIPQQHSLIQPSSTTHPVVRTLKLHHYPLTLHNLQFPLPNTVHYAIIVPKPDLWFPKLHTSSLQPSPNWVMHNIWAQSQTLSSWIMQLQNHWACFSSENYEVVWRSAKSLQPCSLTSKTTWFLFPAQLVLHTVQSQGSSLKFELLNYAISQSLGLLYPLKVCNRNIWFPSPQPITLSSQIEQFSSLVQF